MHTADATLTVIERRARWRPADLKELWQHRELLYFLGWRDVKVRYKQTLLGAAWAVLQPVATMLIFTAFVGRLVPKPSGGVPYPLFVFAGLLPWSFFSSMITAAGQSVVTNQTLVTKIYFPRLLIPMGAVAAGLVDFAITFGLLLLMVAFYGVLPGWGFLQVPLITLVLIGAALGIGTLLAALTVAYRDFRHVLPFMVQLWMLATPCVYMEIEGQMSPRWLALLPLNPAYGIVLNFRRALLGQPLDMFALGVSSAVAAAGLAVGYWYFRRVERTFADVI